MTSKIVFSPFLLAFFVIFSDSAWAQRAVADLTLDEIMSTFQTPLPGGGPTSNWCVCRSVGTSPHVGIDLSRGGRSLTSVSLNHTKVMSKQFLGAACGWAVVIEDQGGAQWRYLHLDNPTHLKVGDRLRPGAVVGIHKSYPTRACGTGIHLHLERRTAGAFADRERYRDCGRGLAACHFNPNPTSSFDKISPLAESALFAEELEGIGDTVDTGLPVSSQESCQPRVWEPVAGEDLWAQATPAPWEGIAQTVAVASVAGREAQDTEYNSEESLDKKRISFVENNTQQRRLTLDWHPAEPLRSWQLVVSRGGQPQVAGGGSYFRVLAATGSQGHGTGVITVAAADNVCVGPQSQVFLIAENLQGQKTWMRVYSSTPSAH